MLSRNGNRIVKTQILSHVISRDKRKPINSLMMEREKICGMCAVIFC